MSVPFEIEYLSIGGNRQTAGSSYDKQFNLLAFGADENVALWQPLSSSGCGVEALLTGHHDKVTAVCFVDAGGRRNLVSGAADGKLLLWRKDVARRKFAPAHRLKAHDGAVNTIASITGSDVLVTGGADTFLKVWRTTETEVQAEVAIKTNPRFIPLAVSAAALPGLSTADGFFVAAAGTRNDIFVFAVNRKAGTQAVLACTLTGHEGWIRSLALKPVCDGYLLASTSHDKYVRLWRLSSKSSQSQRSALLTGDLPLEPTLTAKVKSIVIGEARLNATFEALLLGHEDWVYSADWQEGDEGKLLTTSADGTLSIWEPDEDSGIWISDTRLGEMSGLKGATTATGSSGGFWTGRWVYNAESATTGVISLSRTGSWRLWTHDVQTNFYNLRPALSGHVAPVNDLSWSPDGGYLLSTSSDQTTRLHAEYHQRSDKVWHEFSRPQIHGYDLNCITCISTHQFTSGADEKLLRVFDEPKELAGTLSRLCGISIPEQPLPETASIPVLGLSNKVVGEPDDIIEAGPRDGSDVYGLARSLAGISIAGIDEPPTEDLLARHTLWPEHDKLYGHGYEISESAYSRGLLATACKASSIDHATIRVYDTGSEFREVLPPLKAHSLTVTRLAWSQTGQFLLSVGRDRQWTIFERAGTGKQLKSLQEMPKAHSRMILDAAWCPAQNQQSLLFCTAGRDKTVKFWVHLQNTTQFELAKTVETKAAVTAIDCVCNSNESELVVAIGEEDGSISIHWYNLIEQDDRFLTEKRVVVLPADVCASKSITRMAWRPQGHFHAGDGADRQLAVASADGSLRITRIQVDRD